MTQSNHWLQNLEASAASYPAVGFDMFGTLVFRDLEKPTDLFRWMEQCGTAPAGFAERRIQAEQRARTRHPHQEVTLAEIYQAGTLGVAPEEECRAEELVVTANGPLQALCGRLRAQGKKLYLISDMYLPKRQIEKMLSACGYSSFDGVYVSSEYGVQKRSGKLFRLFLERENIAPGQFLFVGDDRRADWAGAALAGITCRLLPPRAPLPHTPKPATPALGAQYARVQNSIPRRESMAALGAETLGPLLTGFSFWLQKQAGQTGGHLVLLARDMYLTRAVCKILYPHHPAEYLKVSRKSLCPALLLAAEDAEGRELLLDMLPRETLSLDEIEAFCGFEHPASIQGFDAKQTFDLRLRPASAAVEQLLAALHSMAKMPDKNGRGIQGQAAMSKAYLDGAGISRPGAVLVDIGSGGTTQRALEKILHIPLQGRYLACDERLHRYLPPERARAYLFGGEPAPLWFWMGQPLLEYLISEPCGATMGYCMGADGKPHPCVADGTSDPQVKQLQAGALAYVRRCKNGLDWETPAPEQDIEPFLDLMRHPRLWEARQLGSFLLEDGLVYKLAAPQPIPHYLAHPAELTRDLGASHWKIGFLKNLLRVPAPYDALYRFLKNH